MRELVIDLILIRHGQTQGNRAGRYVGRTDEAVCEDGLESLRCMRESGIYPAIERLYSSPMRRCLQTGGILYPDHEPVTIEDWREMDFGMFEGRNFREMEDWPRYQAWIDSGGTMPFPGGESREGFAKRTFEGLRELMNGILGEDQPPARIGALIHGGVIMSLMSQINGDDFYSYLVQNGRGYRCRLSVTQDTIQMLEYEAI